jgi:hypothetical protein
VPGDGLRVTIIGDRNVERAFAALPREATRELKDGSERLARQLANAIRRAGRASDEQSARASRTVRVARALFPRVVAGPHPLLMGSEFGVIARFGWYRKGRYHDSPLRQFRGRTPGNVGYWFFPTYVRERPTITREHRQMADAIVRQFGA